MVMASTVEDRLALLEAKDKAEHKRRQAASSYSLLPSNVSERQVVTLGTCPDMCPETERCVHNQLVHIIQQLILSVNKFL